MVCSDCSSRDDLYRTACKKLLIAYGPCPYYKGKGTLKCSNVDEQDCDKCAMYPAAKAAKHVNALVHRANEREELKAEIINLKKRVKKLEDIQNFTNTINEAHERVKAEIRVPRGSLFPEEFDTPWAKKGKEWELVDDKVQFYLSLPLNACRSNWFKKALEDAIRYGFKEGERFGKYEKACQSVFDRTMEAFIKAGEEDCGNKGGK